MNNLKIADISGYLSRPSEPELELSGLFNSNAQLVILDIGACEGEDSIRYAKRFPNAKVYTFEPLPVNQLLIQANFEKYKVNNTELVPLALSAHAGSAEFHVSAGRPEKPFCGDNWNYGNKSSSLLPPAKNEPMHGWIKFPEKIAVQCDTLQSFCASRGINRVDFIHMDVQGAESLVLAGAGSTLKRIVAMWLEVSEQELYQGQQLRPEIEKYLMERGFVLVMQMKREIEGDQFYVNLRFPCVWPYLAGRRARQWWQRLRFNLGRLKNLFFIRIFLNVLANFKR